MTESIQNIISYIDNNPLIATLMSGGAIVWLFANLRSISMFILDAILACTSFIVANTYEDNRSTSYYGSLKLKQQMFNIFLSESKAIWERTVNLDLSHSVDIYSFDKSNNRTSSQYASSDNNSFFMADKMVNAYGFSIRLIFGKICFVARSYKLDGQKIIMNTSIRVFFARKKSFLAKLEDTIYNKVAETIKANGINESVMVWNADTFTGKKMKRSLDSIFTANDLHKALFNNIKSFIDNKGTYQKLNYPYNYCALLYGSPGAGKTSTILAIASELKRDVRYINLSQTNSSQLLKTMNDNPNRSIFVFEDIDAISFKGADAREKNKTGQEQFELAKAFGISLSDLLNITDGLLASDGTICLFTTNHIERLDPAFLRAGRMNTIVEFTYMTPSVAQKMVEKYLGVTIDNLMDNIKPAELQEIILGILLEKNTIEDLKSRFCRV